MIKKIFSQLSITAKNSPLLIAIFFFMYGMYLRLIRLNNRELWVDEIHQYKTMLGEFKPFWQRLRYGDVTAFPGEYILGLPVINISSMNKWVLAIPHFFITILGFYLLYILCVRYMRSWVGFFITFMMFSMNSNLVYHALEFRPYAVLPVLALAALVITGVLATNFNSLSLVKKIFIAIAIVGIVNYHAYGIFIFMLPLLFQGLSLLIDTSKGEKDFKEELKSFPWVFLTFTLAVAGGIWFWYIGFTAPPWLSTFEFIQNPTQNPIGFLKDVFGNICGDTRFKFLLLACLPFLPNPNWAKQFTFLAVLVILPIEIILLLDLKSQYWFVQRQFVWVMPFFAIWVGWSIDSLYMSFLNHRCKIKS